MFEKYQRRQAELDQAIAALFVPGVSTARVGEVLGHLTTIPPSAATVSRVFHTLDEEFTAWKQLKYAAIYPGAVECLQRDLEACLTFYAFPKTHWHTIRTTNVVERLFCEVKKRSHKMATAFRNEGSCLLMFYAGIRSLHFCKLQMPKKESTQEPFPAVLHNS